MMGASAFRRVASISDRDLRAVLGGERGKYILADIREKVKKMGK